ncbi:MAG: DMT family transporter [Burkholderiales bacterium]
MSHALRPRTIAYLTLPPLLWASNAIVGRLSVSGGAPLVSPLMLNCVRWAVMLLLLAPIVWVSARRTPGAPSLAAVVRRDWRIFLAFGVLAVASYNSLQYMALKTSSAINVTLIAASGPLFSLVLGRLFFGENAHVRAWLGAALSLAGVVVVLTEGEAARLAGLRFVPGDLLMIVATVVWSLYSWLLRRHRPDLPVLAFLLLQTGFGVVIAVPLVGAEWLAGDFVLVLSAATLAVVLWVATGPSFVAYWCWDRGVAEAGPLLPMFFANLTPFFAALMSAALLREPPHAFHGLAFLLIVGGIVVAQWRRPR